MVRTATWNEKPMTESGAKVNGRPERAIPAWWFALLLAGTTLALFWPARGFDYVHLDDHAFVAANPMVAGGLNWSGVRQAFTTVHEQWWLPLLWISYMADVDVFGPGPHGHHLGNVLLHAANAALLFWALFRMTGSRWRSAFVAALFAWHPTRVEAVAWITARKDVLSGLFFMLALLAYVRYAERPSARKMGLVFGALLAGLMSKAVLIALPPILLLLDYWPLRRTPAAGAGTAWKGWKPRLAEKAGLIVLAAAFTGLNLWTHESGRGAGSHVSVVSRLGLIAPNYFDYLEKIAAPIRLNVIYPENDAVSWPVSIAALLALSAATAWAIRAREKRPFVAVGWLWFLVALLPVIRGVRLGFAQAADRFGYLPLIGLGIAAAWTAGEWAERRPRQRPALGLAGGLVLAACLVRTPAQLGWWGNSAMLFQRAVFLAPGSSMAHDSLGLALRDAGRDEEGAFQFREAVRLNPRAAGSWNNLGNALVALGRTNEALAAFEEALALEPDLAEAHYNLGGALFRAGKVPDALPHFEAAARLAPGQAVNWYDLGITYAQLGRYAEAAPCVDRALRLDPELPGAKWARIRLQTLGF